MYINMKTIYKRETHLSGDSPPPQVKNLKRVLVEYHPSVQDLMNFVVCLENL